MTFLLRRRSTDPGHGNGPLGNTSRRPAATDADIAGMLFHPPSSRLPHRMQAQLQYSHLSVGER